MHRDMIRHECVVEPEDVVGQKADMGGAHVTGLMVLQRFPAWGVLDELQDGTADPQVDDPLLGPRASGDPVACLTLVPDPRLNRVPKDFHPQDVPVERDRSFHVAHRKARVMDSPDHMNCPW